jgi:peptide/nickel transport system substrate-binding protein
MKRIKHSFKVILAIVICLSLLAACGGGSTSTGSGSGPAPATTESKNVDITEKGSVTVGGEATEDAKLKEELTVIIDNNKIAVLDPGNTASSTNTTTWAFLLMYNTLVTEENGEILPELATSWKTDDCKHFTFKLRDDVYFHNGDHFTAKDIVYTVNRAKESTGTIACDKLSCVESMNIVDDYTIEITLNNVNVDFLLNLGDPRTGILNQRAIEADPEKGPWIGTGAWKVSEFSSNNYVTFDVNEKYWGELPKTKRLNLKYVAEESTRLMQLENGEVQVAFSINPADFPYLESDDRFDTYSYTINNCAYLGFNINDPITGDINFRKAVASAITRADMVTAGRNGYAVEPDSGTFWGFNTQYKNTDIPLIPYDLEAAKKYLSQSSYKGEPVEIVAAFSDFIKNAQVIQEQLAKIGINVIIYETDAPGIAAYAKYTDNKCQMVAYTGTWLSNASSCRPYFYPGATYNRVSYKNDEVTKLLDLAQTQTNEAEREATYRKIQEIVAEDIPYLNLYNITHVIGCLKGVGGMKLSNNSWHDLTYIYMVE